MSACATVGSACPTFSVPGIFSSDTSFHKRNIVVVVAKDPMPSVSKKLVRRPMGRDRHDARDHSATNTAVTRPSTASRAVFGSIIEPEPEPEHEPEHEPRSEK